MGWTAFSAVDRSDELLSARLTAVMSCQRPTEDVVS